MQSIFLNPPAPLSAPPGEVEQNLRASAVTAVSAFAVVASAYTHEHDLSIVLTLGETSVTTRVEARPSTPLASLVDRVAARLAHCRGLDAGAVIHWSARPEGHADEGLGALLTLAIDLRFMTVNVGGSRQRGLLKTPVAVAQLARHFRTAAAAIRGRRKGTIADVELLGPIERNRLLYRWSRTEPVPEIAAPGLVHHLFEARAKQNPDAIAVLFRDTRLTYGELDERAERLAQALRARAIGKGAFVAIQVPPSPDLYVAILGVLKSGAAYVPLDVECPADRRELILSDCAVAALLTVSSRSGLPLDPAPCPVVCLDDDWEQVLPAPDSTAPVDPPGPNDLCYVIYTSGSTGRPKGVAVEHRSVVHLVRAEQRLFDVQPSDRVLQGFSAAFDAAVEEIWLALAAGATLVPATKEVLLADLPQYMAAWNVTVFSTVPTLLATIEGYLPTVRLLIVGGEACPHELVRRWATPERAMYNTYGPTEATVIATCARLNPDQPVTIGRPIPNYVVYIVTPEGRLAPPGVAGEIYIGGVGLARGYLNDKGRTAASFVPNPFEEREAPERVYKTGDRGRFDAYGNIEFCGRIDDQVKVRGFRVELGEIEAVLIDRGDLVNVQVTLREDTPGAKQIVAYVVPRDGVSVSEQELKRELAAKLPAYMIPAHIEVLGEVPKLPSGKVDKGSLPPPSRPPRCSGTTTWASSLERTIARCCEDLFGWTEISPGAHLFLDFGADSLMVARMVSRLRCEPELRSLSVLDVYEHPTIAGLAALHTLRGSDAVLSPSPPASEKRPSPSEKASRGNYLLCGVAQVVGLYFVFGAYSIQWLAPYLAYVALRSIDTGIGASLLASAGVLVAAHPLLLLLGLATKWLVIGRYKAGRYPLWGSYYFRFWLVDRVLAFVPVELLAGTPLLPAYYRLLGARVGNNVYLGSQCLGCFDLASIGDDSSVGANANLSGYTVEDGALVLGSVRVGSRCTIGSRSVLSHDVSVEDDAQIGELSLVLPGVVVPARERWIGSPARRVGAADAGSPVARPTKRLHRLLTAAFALASLATPMLIVGAFLPGLVGLNFLERHHGCLYLLAAPLVGAAFVVLLCLEIAAIKWLLVGRVTPGCRELHSGFYLRLWVFNRAMEQTLEVVGGLYATLFLNPWYRLLGVRLGKNAEVSTAPALAPDLLDVGNGAFIADMVSLGTPAVSRGYIELSRTRIGNRAFIGNSAVVESGTTVGDDCLVGCLSIAPNAPLVSGKVGATWIGSPPTSLLRRQASPAFPRGVTYAPTRALVAQRLSIEYLRVTLPATCLVALTCLLIAASRAVYAALPLLAFVALFPLLYVAFGVLAALIVIALKWAVIGRYRPGQKPLWNHFVWRTELIAAMHENLADPFFNRLIEGTPFAPWFFRALGARIGRRVYMGTTQLTEYDLVEIGDEACLNNDCTLQTHLFEDRVMKMSTVRIGERCTVGSDAVVLYDTHMEAGSRLRALSLLMKGETLPVGSRWAGSPARAVPE